MRSLTYRFAKSSAPCAMPTACAAIVNPGVVERSHGRTESGSLGADQSVGRNAYVVEVDLSRRRALDAELAFGCAEAHARVALLDDEGRDAARPRDRVGDREYV